VRETAQRTADGRGNPALGVGAAALAMLSWGFGPVIVKLTALDGLTLSFWRLWMGLAVMGLALGVLRRGVDRAAVRRSVVGGVLFGVQMVFFFTAVQWTSVADVMLISALQPVLVLLVASRFGERVDAWTVGWTVLSLVGVALVIVGSAGSPVWSLEGDLLAFAALVVWTGYWLASRRARTGGVGAVEYMAVVTVVATVLVTPVALLVRDVTAVRPQDWGWLVLLAVVPGAGGHLLMAWAHRYVEAMASSLLFVGSPVVSVAAAWAVLGEPIGPLQGVGAAAVLASITAVVRRQAAAPPEAVEAGPPGP
jgi:drug/metabolite transporter (DMT)-like permease